MLFASARSRSADIHKEDSAGDRSRSLDRTNLAQGTRGVLWVLFLSATGGRSRYEGGNGGQRIQEGKRANISASRGVVGCCVAVLNRVELIRMQGATQRSRAEITMETLFLAEVG